MNRDDVIRMAKQADASFETADSMFRFAALIESAATERANERANASWALMCEKMVAAEREACEKECEAEAAEWTYPSHGNAAAMICLNRIRARGKK